MNNPNNPLHGIKLESIINTLVEQYGWEELGRQIN
ncbi:MAG TPA: DNA-binding protein VF530, partial [Desulfobacterales bacterium]|nr:DNA-binding protein VF530 [Desulfobacterales bacterium]